MEEDKGASAEPTGLAMNQAPAGLGYTVAIPSAENNRTDAFILDTYMRGARAEDVAAELGTTPHYIYVRVSHLRKIHNLPSRPASKGKYRKRRGEQMELVQTPATYRYLDWRLVKELTDEGATEGQIAEFFNTAISSVRDAKRAARTAVTRAKRA